MDDIYHQGEKAVQRMAGEETQAQSNSRIIQDFVIKGAVNFIEKQAIAIVSSVDSDGTVWVSLLVGDYGFISVPSLKSVSFNKDAIHSDLNDIFYKNIINDPSVGVLFIELETRRRYRVNGLIEEVDNRLNLTVKEAYANCPKYIQQRVFSMPERFDHKATTTASGKAMTPMITDWISSADTLFVGSQDKTGKMDASHRGGKRGFVKIAENGVLKIPDYQGNSMYNTLGNFYQNPQAGLLFIDFKNRRTLQLTGSVKLVFDQESEEDLLATTGTGRYWLFELEEWIITNNHHLVEWEFLSYSPHNPI